MPAPTGLQQMSASVSGSLTRVHSLVRKAGTLLGPAAPGPTVRSISDEEGKGWGGVLTEWLKAELVSSLHLLSRLLRRPLRTYSKASHGRSHLATGALSQRPDLYPLCAGAGIVPDEFTGPALGWPAALYACARWLHPGCSPIRAWLGGAWLRAHEALPLPEAAVNR